MSVTLEDFALEDYKQKISYLTAHFTRMWTRFNYFVAIETALVGGKFLIPNNVSSRALGIAGVVISAVWYVTGAEDRYQVRLYGFQVKEADKRLVQIIWPVEIIHKAYRHVGEVSQAACRKLQDSESKDEKGNLKTSDEMYYTAAQFRRAEN